MHNTSGKSYNASGVSYKAIALFDPSGRFVIPFAVSKSSTDDNYTHYLRYPESGELASTFTPDFVFGGVANGVTADAGRAALYRGPGHTGDATAKLGVAVANAITVLAADQITVGTALNTAGVKYDVWAIRVGTVTP